MPAESNFSEVYSVLHGAPSIYSFPFFQGNWTSRCRNFRHRSLKIFEIGSVLNNLKK